MRKGLALFFTAITMFAMGLTACSSNTSSTSNIPEWSVHEDGHLYHYEQDLGNVVGPQGEKGDKGDTGAQGEKGEQGLPGINGEAGATGAQGPIGPQGEQGEKGDTGEQGPKGDQGDKGDQGEKGDAGNGIESVSLSNDGYVDTHTLHFTDGSEYSFNTYNPAVSIAVTNNRVSEDDNGDEIEMPYFVGTSAELDITVEATFLNKDVREIDNFEVTGFDTETAGKKDVVVTFGEASDAFAVDVMTLTEAMAEGFAADESFTSLGIEILDEVPAMSTGAADYMVDSGAFFIIPDEDLKVDDAIALYQADLLAANYTDAGEDSYGDKHFASPNEELDICAWNYYDIAIRVDVTVTKKAPTPVDATLESVTWGILNPFYGASYTWDDLVSYQVIQSSDEDEDGNADLYYAYVGFGSGSAAYFQAVLDTVGPMLPKYLEADGEAFDITYSGDAALEQDYISTDGRFTVEVIANLYNNKLYADFYVYAN